MRRLRTIAEDTHSAPAADGFTPRLATKKGRRGGKGGEGGNIEMV